MYVKVRCDSCLNFILIRQSFNEFLITSFCKNLGKAMKDDIMMGWVLYLFLKSNANMLYIQDRVFD
jgi:hypothetical protein